MAASESSHSFRVKLVTEKETHDIELLTEEYLSRFGMKPSDITTIYANYDVPGYLYEEFDVASRAHPCAGSACVVFQDPYGHQYSIDDIVYYDSNPHQSHAGGQPHWNNEIRFVRDGVQIGKRIRGIPHTLEDTPEIKIISDCDGVVNSQKVLRDQPIKEQR